MAEAYFIGIDVGTGSVRAALVSDKGEIKKMSTHDIKIWNPSPGFYEQSSEDIWKSCCCVVKDVINEVNIHQIKGIGFDATCSLVAVEKDGKPVTVSPTDRQEQNVILWMDHRAVEETDFINSQHPEVLENTGGTISLEMQTPKLMWLKKNLPKSWKAVDYFFDLSDFLTWKATGDDSRSLCTTVCKWTFRADAKEFKGWDKAYFSLIKLDDLLNDGAVKIGKTIKYPGEKAGHGLTCEAARDFGLLEGTAVSIGLIDAHAGGLGMMGCFAKDIPASFSSRIALICGTSSCHMAVSENPLKISGVWGPYYSAMMPGLWLNEAGQSATGKLLDFLIETHPAFKEIIQTLEENRRIQDYLNTVLHRLASQKETNIAELTTDIHMWPDFHGNRSPLADSSLRGMLSGLNLLADEEDMAIKYLATLQALAYGTRHIIETMKLNGLSDVASVLVCGGLSKNRIFVQTHADVIGLPVLLPKNSESVLLGSAMLGSVASGYYSNLNDAVQAMAGLADVYLPNGANSKYHSRKYEVFLKMVVDQRSYKAIMTQN